MGVQGGRFKVLPLLSRYRRPSPPDLRLHMLSPAPPSVVWGTRVVICDYHALLISVTGLLRMSGYCVFQAYDGEAAKELCDKLPDIGLLILNTEGTGMDMPTLVRSIREEHPGLPVLHIGSSHPAHLPDGIPTLAESFTADELLAAVRALAPTLESR
jgi:DNA-binding response OmpR family regulator